MFTEPNLAGAYVIGASGRCLLTTTQSELALSNEKADGLKQAPHRVGVGVGVWEGVGDGVTVGAGVAMGAGVSALAGFAVKNDSKITVVEIIEVNGRLTGKEPTSRLGWNISSSLTLIGKIILGHSQDDSIDIRNGASLGTCRTQSRGSRLGSIGCNDPQANHAGPCWPNVWNVPFST